MGTISDLRTSTSTAYKWTQHWALTFKLSRNAQLLRRLFTDASKFICNLVISESLWHQRHVGNWRADARWTIEARTQRNNREINNKYDNMMGLTQDDAHQFRNKADKKIISLQTLWSPAQIDDNVNTPVISRKSGASSTIPNKLLMYIIMDWQEILL